AGGADEMIVAKLERIAGLAPRAVNRVKKSRRRAHLRRVERSLSRPRELDTGASEADFDALQRRFRGVPEYGYDSLSTWRRGSERTKYILESITGREPGASILEVGCGDAMTGYLLSCYGHRVELTDLEDWRDPR